MARISFEIDDKELFQRMLDAAPEKQLMAVSEGAKIVKNKTERLGKEMMSGRFATGETVEGLTVREPIKLMDGASATVAYEGMHSYGSYMKGWGPRRLGEVAFVNEYGARGRSPRPFNRNAVESSENEVYSKMEDIINSDL